MVYFIGQLVKQTGSKNMENIQHIAQDAKINGKDRQIADNSGPTVLHRLVSLL